MLHDDDFAWMDDYYSYHVDGTLPDEHDIFVFGSNEAGIHGAGAALVAKQNFGALQMHGIGAMGRSYAIPTKDARFNTLSLNKIKEYVDEFIQYANICREKTFFVTRIGCGLAGYKDEEIAPLFKNAPPNCDFAIEWKPYID